MRWLWYPHYKTSDSSTRAPAALCPCQCEFSRIMKTASQHPGILCYLGAPGCGLSVNSGIWQGCVILSCSELHFWGWNAIPHLVSHSANLLTPSCSASQSDWSLICLYMMQSSAKSLVFEAILSGRSFLFFLPIRLNLHGGHQMGFGIQVQKGGEVSWIKEVNS